MIQHTH